MADNDTQQKQAFADAVNARQAEEQFTLPPAKPGSLDPSLPPQQFMGQVLDKITGMEKPQGDEITPADSPIDLIAGSAGAALGKKVVESAAGKAVGGALGQFAADEAGVLRAPTAKALPMDEAARLARAKEMGFDTSKTYYHGTKANIEAFDPNALGASTNAGSARQGYFFASDPSTASDYANLAPGRANLRGAIDESALSEEIDAIHGKLSKKYGPKFKTPEAYDAELKYEAERPGMQGLTHEDYKEAGITRVPEHEPLLKQWADVNDRYSKAFDTKILSPNDLSNDIERLSRERAVLSNNPKGFKDLISTNKKSLEYWKDKLENYDGSNVSKFAKTPEDIKNTISKLEQTIEEHKQLISPQGLKEHRAKLKALDAQIAEKQTLVDELRAGQNVLPVHLKMENPYTHDFKASGYRDETYASIMKKAKEAGHDSVIFKNTYDAADPNNRVLQDITAVFEPHQIRSKFSTFDPTKKTEANLSYAAGGIVQKYADGGEAMDNQQVAAPQAPSAPQAAQVNVTNPEGQLVSIPAASLQEALSMGYSHAEPEALKAHFQQEQYGSLGQQAITGLEGLSKGVIGSTPTAAIESGFGVKPEDIRGREEANPITAGITETAGFVGSALIGTGEAAMLAKAGKIGAEATGLARVGGSFIKQVGVDAAKGAFEGALYQADKELAKTFTEDPAQVSDHAVANIGLATVMGGVFGGAIGAGLRGMKMSPENISQGKFVSEMDKPAMEAGDFKTSIENSDLLKPAEKKSILAGLKEQKADAKEIAAAANRLGAPVLEGMTSASKMVQKAEDSLINGDATYTGLKRQDLYKKVYDAGNAAVDSALGEGSKFSKAELGNQLKDSLSAQLREQNAPIAALYDELKAQHSVIPLADGATSGIAKELGDMREVRLSSLNKFLPEIDSLKTVDDVKSLKSIISRSVAPTAPSTDKHVAGIIADRLSQIEEEGITSFAKRSASKEFEAALANLSPEAAIEAAAQADAKAAKITDLLALRKEANAQYKQLITKVQTLSERLGKGRIYGVQDALNFINERLTPEEVSTRLSSVKDSEFQKFFAKEFPREAAQMREYVKGDIREAASKTGEMSAKLVFNKINALEPEIQKNLFSKAELAKLKDAETVLRSIPKNFNPSGTSGMAAFRASFESPIKSAVANFRDYGIEKFIKAVASSPETQGAATLAKATVAGNKAANKGVRDIFDKASVPVGAIPDLAAREKLSKLVNTYAAQPERMLDTGDNNPVPAYAQTFANTSMKAVTYLAALKPKTDPAAPLDHKVQPSNMEKSLYNRALDIANKPLTVLQHIKQGTLTPNDIQALQAIYPNLYNTLQQKVMAAVVDAKESKTIIPYATRMQLSLFLGQPLDSTMTPQGIIGAQPKPQAASAPQGAQGRAPSAASTKGLSKMATQAATPGQARMTEKSQGK